MPNRRKTGKAFKSLKKEGKFRRENLPQNKPKIVIPALKKRKDDLSNLPASEAFERQILELEQRRLGNKGKVAPIANLTVAAPTFTFTAPGKEPTFLADQLLDGEENFIAFNEANDFKNDYRRDMKSKNRFQALADSDDEDDEQVQKKAAFQLQPATFQFQRPEFDDI